MYSYMKFCISSRLEEYKNKHCIANVLQEFPEKATLRAQIVIGYESQDI